MQLEEPLEESAPIAWRIAPELCRKDTFGGEGCAFLHGFWQCLRLMGLAATPDRHRDFYEEALGRVRGGSRPPRVLISGAADYSMLAHALAAFRGRGIEPAFTVIDMCETPLHLNRRYPDRVSCRIQTRSESILDYAVPEPFDAICTHSILGWFLRAQRPDLAAVWRRLLRPDGLLITVHPLRPSGGDEPNRFDERQAQALRAIVADNALRLAKILDADPQDVRLRAERYLRARYGRPVRSREEVLSIFESAGFVVDELRCAAPAADGGAEIGGPGLRTPNVTYAHVIARRP